MTRDDRMRCPKGLGLGKCRTRIPGVGSMNGFPNCCTYAKSNMRVCRTAAVRIQPGGRGVQAPGMAKKTPPRLFILGRLHEWHGWPRAKQIRKRRILHLAG